MDVADNLPFIYKVVIGDYSCDGHNEYQYYYFKSSHDAETITKGYKDAVKKSGITLTSNSHHYKGVKGKEILTKYEDCVIKAEEIKKLLELGVCFDKFDNNIDDGELYCGDEDCAKLFLEMVKTQVPDFQYHLTNDDIKCINGWTGLGGFGYGCFSH